MQIIQSKSQIVEKVIRDKEGRLVRARFTVYEIAGRIKARLLDFVYLDIKDNLKELAGKILSLSGISKKVSSKVNFVYKTLTAPHFAFETIYTSGSKPRAPTF